MIDHLPCAYKALSSTLASKTFKIRKQKQKPLVPNSDICPDQSMAFLSRPYRHMHVHTHLHIHAYSVIFFCPKQSHVAYAPW